MLYYEMADVYEALTDAQAGRLFKGIMSSNRAQPDFSDDPTLNVVWIMIRHSIERDSRKYDEIVEKRKSAGSAGGKASASKDQQSQANGSKDQQSQANGSKDQQIKPTTTTTTTSNSTTTTKKDEPTRHKYGRYTNVLLSDDEMHKLREEFPGDWQQRIERLSEYMASSGTAYKSHLATIRSWARKDAEKTAAVRGTGIAGGARQIDADEETAIRRLMERM